MAWMEDFGDLLGLRVCYSKLSWLPQKINVYKECCLIGMALWSIRTKPIRRPIWPCFVRWGFPGDWKSWTGITRRIGTAYRAAKLPRARWDDADRAWRAQYAKHSPQLITGARQVLVRLGRAHHLGLVTSGDRDRVTRQLRAFRLTQLFAARVCSGDTPEKKPHPAPLRLALRKLRLEPAACVYVGDSPEDLQMAKRAGVRAIAVLGPFPTENRLRAARPDFLLESIRELPEVLKRICG
jgi:HAD superfamily hydrolase (TIGR01549 family)